MYHPYLHLLFSKSSIQEVASPNEKLMLRLYEPLKTNKEEF